MEKKKRTLKNIVMIAVAVLMIAAIAFTTGIIRPGVGNMSQGDQVQPPQMQSEDGDVQVNELSDETDKNASRDSNSEKKAEAEPPEKPDGENPPEMKDGKEQPELPEGMGESDMKKPPSGDNAKQAGKPEGTPGGMRISRFILTGAEGLILSIIIMYLIISGFNIKTFRETLPTAKKKIIYIIAVVVLGAAIFATASFIPTKLMGGNGGPGGPGNPGQLQDGQDKQVTELQDDENQDDDTESGEQETE